MSYSFNDNSNQNEIYENEFFYNLGLEFPLSKKVYSYKNKVSYSKEKKIWFIRYKQDNTYIYLFGYNYGNDRQLDTKDPLLILKFNLFNAPNMGNGHFAVDNDIDEVRAVMNIQYKNYHSHHKSENLTSISPIIVDSDNYLDLGNIRDSKELCENIELLLDEIESIFFFNRYLNRIKDNTPIKNNLEVKKQTVATVEIKKEQNNIPNNIKEIVVETKSEVNLKQTIPTVNCDFCGSEILNDDPFKICKSCRVRISNYLDLLCADYEINTKIPLENLLHNAQEHNLNRKNVEDITKTLMKYKYLHKLNGKFQIDYNNELRDFIDEYSTKTENKTDDIENKVILVAEKIGLNTPFDITYLKETLNFKNSEISKMINYLDEKNAIVEDGEYFILVDKSNEINGINDNIMDNDIKLEYEIKTSPETADEPNTERSIDEKSNSELNSENELSENNPQIDSGSLETSDEKPTIELRPLNTKNKTDIEIFYEAYEKVLTFMENNVQLAEIASKLGITENRLNAWIEKGKNGQKPYRLLSDGIKKINYTSISKINAHKWKKIIEDTKAGYSVFEAADRAHIPYPILQFHLTKGKQGKEGYKEYYEDYQNALNGYDQDEIKTHNRCQICNEILSDESKFICDDCESKKKFAIDLKILMERLKHDTQFTFENLIVYYNDNEISYLIDNLEQFDLVLKDKSLHIFYLKKENIKNFLNTYFDAKNSTKINSERTNLIKNKTKIKKTRKIFLAESKNVPYPFTGLNKDHTFIRSSGSSSKFTLEDVISIHKNYYEDLYSVDKIAKKMGLSELTIKKLIVRFDEGDFDKFIEIVEKENENIIDEDENEFKEFNETNSSKIKIITSIEKELITSEYIKLTFTGKLPNNKIDSSIVELLNELKSTKRALKLIPLNKNECEIIFYIITKDSLSKTNMEILKKYNWHLEIEK